MKEVEKNELIEYIKKYGLVKYDRDKVSDQANHLYSIINSNVWNCIHYY